MHDTVSSLATVLRARDRCDPFASVLHVTCLLSLLIALYVTTLLRPAAAQEPDPIRIRVFVDCDQEACDRDHFQRQILFVDWVRDQRDADVHMLITDDDTGGGGTRFELAFRGRQDFEGLDETLRYTSSATDTEAEVREGLTKTVEAGLFRYAARTPTLQRIEITYDPQAGASIPPAAEHDPWKRWVFQTSLGGSFAAEERSKFASLSASQSISRVTEGMKFGLEIGGDYSESNFDTSDTTTVTSITRSYEVELLYVASVGSHWGIGFRGSAEHSTYRNYDLALLFAPAIEYNIFPYEESTRRKLVFLYAVGPRRFNYIEETIYLQTEETRFQQYLSVNLDFQQPWGGADLVLRASHFLDDFQQNRLEAYATVELRLFRGLSMFITGGAARVRDQINLPRGDATEEEVLLRQRELETDFQTLGSIGFNITFGSVFTDVVNPRFGG
jgi:hypothetical protein